MQTTFSCDPLYSLVANLYQFSAYMTQSILQSYSLVYAHVSIDNTLMQSPLKDHNYLF